MKTYIKKPAAHAKRANGFRIARKMPAGFFQKTSPKQKEENGAWNNILIYSLCNFATTRECSKLESFWPLRCRSILRVWLGHVLPARNWQRSMHSFWIV
jgi:hypothetical protein